MLCIRQTRSVFSLSLRCDRTVGRCTTGEESGVRPALGLCIDPVVECHWTLEVQVNYDPTINDQKQGHWLDFFLSVPVIFIFN